MVEATADKAREAWLEERDLGVQASEVATILSLNPWESRLQLWARRTGKTPPIEESESMVIGHVIEEAISLLFCRDTDRYITDPGQYLIQRNDDFPLLGATLDRQQIKSGTEMPGTLELKNAGWRVGDHWVNEAGDQVVPDYVDAQVQAQMYCAKLSWGSVAVLIGGNQFRWADIERKPDAWFDDLKEQVSAFWALVQSDIPPEASAKDADVLKHLYPQHEIGKVELLPIEAVEIGADLRRLKAEAKAIKGAIDGHETMIKGWIMDAERGVAPDGSYWDWKTSLRKAFTVEAKSTRTLRMTGPKEE
jgi:putative phage-type endonuclease